jgi:hypothetical protein
MKNRLVYLFLICSILLLIASLSWRYISYFSNEEKQSLKLTEIKVNKNNIDVGKVTDRKYASGKFYIKNVGDFDLILNDVKVSCACSSITFLQERILPDDSVAVTVQYNKNTGGYFYSDVLVYGNFSGSPKILSFEGFYSNGKTNN